MISPYKVTWDTFSSLDFDVLTDLAFESDDGTVETHLSREAVVSETYNGLKRISGYKWNDNFTFQLTLIKNDFGDFSPEENRKILRWLTGRKTVGFLEVYKDDSEVIDFVALGNFVNVSSYKLGNGRIVGYVADWESCLPYALSDINTITQSVSDPASSTFTINLETDDSMPVYPRITIQQSNLTTVVKVSKPMGNTDIWVPGTVYHCVLDNNYYWVDAQGVKHVSSTNTSGFETTMVSITNIHTDEYGNKHAFESMVTNNIRGETVVLDGANKVVSSSRSVGRIFGSDFDWQWLPLYEGSNEITIIGNCTVTLDWRSVVKIGEY